MYSLVDRKVAELDPGSRLLIWSMRRWVTAMGERRCALDVLAGAFAQSRALGGLQPFLRVMATLNRFGLQNFEFCAPSCHCVSEHEAIIVSLVTALHEQCPAKVRTTLGLLVEDERVEPLLVALIELDKALLAAKLFAEIR